MPVNAKSSGKTVIEAILARRSVRAYKPDKLSESIIKTLLEAAIRAPTAMHEEPWAFVVVQDKSLLKLISDHAKPLFVEEMSHSHSEGIRHSFDHFTWPDFNIFYDASTLIIICARPIGQFVAADCWLAAENLMLTACEMGLGSCVIGSAVSTLNTRMLKLELGIPDEYAAIAPIIVGLPSGKTEASDRKEPVILAWKH